MTDQLSWKTKYSWQKILYFSINRSCHQRPPLLRDHILMATGVAVQDRFYCINICAKLPVPTCCCLNWSLLSTSSLRRLRIVSCNLEVEKKANNYNYYYIPQRFSQYFTIIGNRPVNSWTGRLNWTATYPPPFPTPTQFYPSSIQSQKRMTEYLLIWNNGSRRGFIDGRAALPRLLTHCYS